MIIDPRKTKMQHIHIGEAVVERGKTFEFIGIPYQRRISPGVTTFKTVLSEEA